MKEGYQGDYFFADGEDFDEAEEEEEEVNEH